MILTKKKFTNSVEQIVIEKHLSYIDAIVYFCQENHLEPESVKGLITPPLKYNVPFVSFLRDFDVSKVKNIFQNIMI